MKSMPRAILLTAAMLAVVTTTGYAADAVTFYEHVAPIFQANCVSCHRPAGQNIGSLVAPMSLMTYEETRPWARAIARKVKAPRDAAVVCRRPQRGLHERAGSYRQGDRHDRGVGQRRLAGGDKSKAPATGPVRRYRQRRLLAGQTRSDRQDAAVCSDRRSAGRAGRVRRAAHRRHAAARRHAARVGVPRGHLSGGPGHGPPHVRRGDRTW